MGMSADDLRNVQRSLGLQQVGETFADGSQKMTPLNGAFEGEGQPDRMVRSRCRCNIS
jgi:hypothetical protein